VLREPLASAPKQPTRPSERGSAVITFAQACEHWLRYVEHERKRTPSTIADYRSAVRAHLLGRLPCWPFRYRV
jgi:hypothetical protein